MNSVAISLEALSLILDGFPSGLSAVSLMLSYVCVRVCVYVCRHLSLNFHFNSPKHYRRHCDVRNKII